LEKENNHKVKQTLSLSRTGAIFQLKLQSKINFRGQLF